MYDQSLNTVLNKTVYFPQPSVEQEIKTTVHFFMVNYINKTTFTSIHVRSCVYGSAAQVINGTSKYTMSSLPMLILK